MKQGIVGGRYGAAQTGLLGALRFPLNQVLSLLEQAFGQTHPLFPRGIVQLGLLGFAAKIEVGFHAELFLRLDDLQNCRCYPLRRLVAVFRSAGAIGKQHAKEDCRGTGGVACQRIPHFNHVWS
jgi:hypothetical protein